MKLKKILALGLSVIMIGELALVNASAIEQNSYLEEKAFIISKGFALSDIINTEKVEDGVKFEMNYLPSGESSYVVYEEKNNDIVITIIEGEKEDEIIYKESGAVYLDGERNKILEAPVAQSSNMSSQAMITSFSNNHIMYAAMAPLYYSSLSSVPGYSYWRTQSWEDGKNFFGDCYINITVGMTVGRLVMLLTAKYPVGAALLAPFAKDLLEQIAAYGITSYLVKIRINTKVMYNPQTLQSLYRIQNSAVIFSSTVYGYVYRLENYN